MKIWYCLFNRVAYAISYGVIDAIHMPTSGISRYHLIPNRYINKILRQIENYDNLLPGLDGTVNLLYIDDVFLYWLTGDGGSSRLTAATRKSSALSIIQLVSYKNTERKRESRTRLIGLGPVNASSTGSWILAHLLPLPPTTTMIPPPTGLFFSSLIIIIKRCSGPFISLSFMMM